MNDTFVIVVPTIRQGLPGFAETIEKIKSSLTVPTDFRVLDGRSGKVAALNRAYDEVLLLTESKVYVTMDDDFVPPRGWQEAVLRVFDTYDNVGVVCPWPGDAPRWIDYVGADSVAKWIKKDGFERRYLKPWRHIPGCLLAFRRTTAIELGKTPESHRRYDVYEDCWRGRMAYKLGWRSMYVNVGPCQIYDYVDTDAYIAEKADAIDESRAESAKFLADSGLGDPWTWRLRRWIARARGRTKRVQNTTRDVKVRREQRR